MVGANRYAISSDGRYIAVIRSDEQLDLYDVEKTEPIQTFDSGHGHGSTFSDDSRCFIYGGSGFAHFWDLETNQPARPRIQTDRGETLRSGRDHSLLLVWVHGNLWALNPESSEGKRLTTGLSSNICYGLTGDAKHVVVSNRNARLELWDPTTGELVRRFGFRHSGNVRLGKFSWRQGHLVVPSVRDGNSTVRIWRPDQPDFLVLRGHSSYVYPVAVDHKGTRIVSGSWDGTARIWDSDTGEQLMELEHDGGEIHDLALDSNSSRVATVTADKTIRVWDLASASLLASTQLYPGGAEMAPNLCFSKDGSKIFCIAGQRLHKIAAESLEIERRIETGLTPDNLAASPSGKFVAVVSHSKTESKLTLRDPDDLTEINSTTIHSPVSSPVKFSVYLAGIKIGLQKDCVGAGMGR